MTVGDFGTWVGAASLMRGPIPATVQALSAAALVAAVGGRHRGRRVLWLPISVVVGAALGAAARSYYATLGVSSEPPPPHTWLWVSLTGVALAATLLGWSTARWWQRNAAVFAASFCALSLGLTINGWIGYFPTVSIAWSQLSNAPLPDQIDLATAQAMRSNAAQPPLGAVVPVTVSAAASRFPHRPEWVYLPPAWFSAAAGDTFPVVMMIGGEFNTPSDWLRAGDAATTLKRYAQAHAGRAPLVVFVDPSGAFTTDTECVNGSRGNAADHLTDDVVPYMVATFGASADPARWAVVGFSSGGTCALDLTVMHPETFATFLDIAGDAGPNAGTRQQTIDRLFGGDRSKWAAFDPATVIAAHGRYTGVAGVFTVPSSDAGGFLAPLHARAGQSGEARAALALCAEGTAHGIDCAVLSLRGHHDWPFAQKAFAATLPWLATRLQGTATCR